jgi:LmbE family N-acetylglucosaminyl deacetylase
MMAVLGIALAAAAVIVLCTKLCAARYRGGFRLPSRRDDHFHWNTPAARHDLVITGRGFELPAGVDGEGQTGLLRVVVQAATGVGCRDPRIELRRGAAHCRQYLDRGARGTRYLDITSLMRGADTRRVELHGAGLRLGPHAQLLLFDAPTARRARLLVLAPHPDDAEICAFGLYSQHDSWLATITAGERLRDPETRATEVRAAAALGDVPPQRCIALAYPDGQLERMALDPGREFELSGDPGLRARLRATNSLQEFRATPGCRWPALVLELRRVVDLAMPDFIVTPHPQLDSHLDHRTVTRALAEALEGGRTEPTLLLTTVHVPGASRFPPGGDDGLVSMPPGDCLAGDAAYSLQLGAALQARKRAALLAISAVRASAGLEATTHRNALLRGLDAACGLGAWPENLLRRSCRPNELFQVASMGTLRAMLAGTRGGP